MDDDTDIIDIAMTLLEEGAFDLIEDDVEEAAPPGVWGGSRPGKARNLERHRVTYSHLLYNDFWGPTPVYDRCYFKKFFKLPIGLFDSIVERICMHDSYFLQKRCAAGKLGLSTLQKVCRPSFDIRGVIHGTRRQVSYGCFNRHAMHETVLRRRHRSLW